MALAVYGEILIAVYIVGKESQAALKRHHKRAKRQHIALRPRQAGAGFSKAAREHTVQVQIEPYTLQLPLILRRGGRAEADRVAEIVGRQPRHDGVEVNDAQRTARVRVEQDVIYLRVVVRDADGQLPRVAHTLERTRALLAFEYEVDLLLHGRRAAKRVGADCGAELLISHGRIVEIHYRLLKRLRRETAQCVLKMPERPRTLIEIGQGLRALEAYAVIDEPVSPPAAALSVVIIVFAVARVDVAYHGHALVLPAQIRAYRGHVAHYRVNVRENVLIDPLQDIFRPRIGRYQIGLVYMAAFYLFALRRSSVRREMEYCIFHRVRLISFFRFFSASARVSPSASGLPPPRGISPESARS